MNITLDHFFIITPAGGAIGDRIKALGLEESFSRDHPGQGTSNRRFLVSNSMLELIWVRDKNEALNGPGRKLNFPERASEMGAISNSASPFGLVFTQNDMTASVAPFAGWDYQPDYFEPPNAFRVADNSDDITEPLCICAPNINDNSNAKISTVGPFQFIRSVKLTVKKEKLSGVLEQCNRVDGLTVVAGDKHLLEVYFSSGSGENKPYLEHSLNREDFRPDLPLIIYWKSIIDS